MWLSHRQVAQAVFTLSRVAGFIILEDGRAYAASNRASDRTVRAIAAEIRDVEFGAWLTGQQSEFLGMGMVGIDLREIAPAHRSAFYAAVRHAHARAAADGFEELVPGTPEHSGWLSRLDDLVLMITLWEAGEPPEEFNPHMREICPPTGQREGALRVRPISFTSKSSTRTSCIASTP